MNKINEAQIRMKSRYNEMVNGERACSTLWENWDYDFYCKNNSYEKRYRKEKNSKLNRWDYVL